jgi:hypothetical protein
MPAERHSLVQSIRLTGNGFSVRLRIDRSRPQDLEEFLRENDLTDRIDFDINVPVSLTPETIADPRQLTAA